MNQLMDGMETGLKAEVERIEQQYAGMAAKIFPF
jgi:hypothetical protein